MSESSPSSQSGHPDSFNAARVLGRESEPTVDPVKLAHDLAARSRRRVLWLTAATALAWIVACGAAIWTVEIYFNEIQRNMPFQEYRYAQLHEEIEGIPWDELTERQQREISARERAVDRANELMMVLSQASIGLFGVAALLSIWLILASRRATLRQINANLLTITTELRTLMTNDQ